MNRIYVTRTFARWMRTSDVNQAALCQAVHEMHHGLIDADLSGHVYKKRVALPGRGKRAGARVIVATRFRSSWFFLFGFAKSERATVNETELRALQELARTLLELDSAGISTFIAQGGLKEIEYDDSQNDQNN